MNLQESWGCNSFRQKSQQTSNHLSKIKSGTQRKAISFRMVHQNFQQETDNKLTFDVIYNRRAAAGRSKSTSTIPTPIPTHRQPTHQPTYHSLSSPPSSPLASSSSPPTFLFSPALGPLPPTALTVPYELSLQSLSSNLLSVARFASCFLARFAETVRET